MLYKASGEEEYLNDAEAYFNDDDISELSWDKKNVLAAVSVHCRYILEDRYELSENN